MIRKARTVLTACLVLLTLALSTTLTAAQQPLSPRLEVTPPLQGHLKEGFSAPLGDKLAVPDAVRTTVKLRESLSANQQAAIRAVLDRHALDLQAIRQRLPEQGNGANLSVGNKLPRQQQLDRMTEGNTNVAGSNSKVSAQDIQRDTNLLKNLGKTATRLKGIQDQIDREVTALLTADQQALYLQSVKPLQQAGAQTAAAINREASIQSTSDCFYGAYYGTIAKYYAYVAYYYGYYDYYYYGNTYAYYDYLYNYYAYSYAYNGLRDAAAAYFDSAYGFGYDFNNQSDSAYTNFVYAEYYAYYGSLYGYYSYYYYGSAYGYYGYYYGYYADYYSYYAYYYSYYCT